MKIVTILITLISVLNSTIEAQEDFFKKAFDKIVLMHDSTTLYNFKEAVLTVENAYYDNTLNIEYINNQLKVLSSIVVGYSKTNTIKDYDYKDLETVNKQASIYKVITDSTTIFIKNKLYKHIPFTYDFKDIWGDKEWSNTFVTKLLNTRRGNCHSLPYLYKIIAEEIGIKAHLALAPNHTYIKLQNEENGWYNVELTSGYFPIDAWIMASGYIHLNSVRNSMYMKVLTDKENLALLLIDLAQGYNRKFKDNDGLFALKCAEKALEYYPNYSNALLLRLEVNSKKIEDELSIKGEDFIAFVNQGNKGENGVNLKDEIINIHNLGYREMPREMYTDWLLSLEQETRKYKNQKVKLINNN